MQDDEKMGCSLYRQLAPQKWKFRLSMAVKVISGLVVVFGFSAICVIYANTDGKETPWVNMLLFAICVGLFLLFVFVTVAQMQTAEKLYRKRKERLKDLSADELFVLQEEISLTEPEFGKLYLLRKYLYVPQERILIPLRETKQWSYGVPPGKSRNFAILEEKDGYKNYIALKQMPAFIRTLPEFNQKWEKRKTEALRILFHEKLERKRREKENAEKENAETIYYYSS